MSSSNIFNPQRFESRLGVFINEIDLTLRQDPVQETVNQLVPGFSRKGPFNRPRLIRSSGEMRDIFGSIDRVLENRKSYFHRTVFNCLRTGPVYAISLLHTDDELDKFEFSTMSVRTDNTNSEVRSEGVSRFFDKEDFWDRDSVTVIEAVSRYLNPDLNSEIITESKRLRAEDLGCEIDEQVFPVLEQDKILHFVNMGNKDLTIFTFHDPEAVSLLFGDITIDEWYREQSINGAAQDKPSWIEGRSLLTDYFIRVVVLEGDWTDYNNLSENRQFFTYFTREGAIKSRFGLFLNDPAVPVLGNFTVSLIPLFRDADNRNYDMETVINAGTDIHGLYVAYDDDMLADTDFPNGTIDLIGNNIADSQATHINFLSYQEDLTEIIPLTPTMLNRPGNMFYFQGNYFQQEAVVYKFEDIIPTPPTELTGRMPGTGMAERINFYRDFNVYGHSEMDYSEYRTHGIFLGGNGATVLRNNPNPWDYINYPTLNPIFYNSPGNVINTDFSLTLELLVADDAYAVIDGRVITSDMMKVRTGNGQLVDPVVTINPLRFPEAVNPQNRRYDVIYLDANGNLMVKEGIEAGEDVVELPVVPENVIILAMVKCISTDTLIPGPEPRVGDIGRAGYMVYPITISDRHDYIEDYNLEISTDDEHKNVLTMHFHDTRKLYGRLGTLLGDNPQALEYREREFNYYRWLRSERTYQHLANALQNKERAVLVGRGILGVTESELDKAQRYYKNIIPDLDMVMASATKDARIVMTFDYDVINSDDGLTELDVFNNRLVKGTRIESDSEYRPNLRTDLLNLQVVTTEDCKLNYWDNDGVNFIGADHSGSILITVENFRRNTADNLVAYRYELVPLDYEPVIRRILVARDWIVSPVALPDSIDPTLPPPDLGTVPVVSRTGGSIIDEEARAEYPIVSAGNYIVTDQYLFDGLPYGRYQIRVFEQVNGVDTRSSDVYNVFVGHSDPVRAAYYSGDEDHSPEGSAWVTSPIEPDVYAFSHWQFNFPLVVDVKHQNISRFDAQDGKITVLVAGGTPNDVLDNRLYHGNDEEVGAGSYMVTITADPPLPPDYVNFQEGASPIVFENLPPGQYTVQVIDRGGPQQGFSNPLVITSIPFNSATNMADLTSDLELTNPANLPGREVIYARDITLYYIDDEFVPGTGGFEDRLDAPKPPLFQTYPDQMGVLSPLNPVYEQYINGVVNSGDFFLNVLFQAGDNSWHPEDMIIFDQTTGTITLPSLRHRQENYQIFNYGLRTGDKIQIAGTRYNDGVYTIQNSIPASLPVTPDRKYRVAMNERLQDEIVAASSVSMWLPENRIYTQMLLQDDNLRVRYYSDSNLTPGFEMDNGIPFNATTFGGVSLGDYRFYQSLPVVSLKSNFKQSVDVVELPNRNEIAINKARYTELQVNDYLMADTSVQALEPGQMPRKLARIIKRENHPCEPDLILLTTDINIKIYETTVDSQTYRQTFAFKTIDNYIEHYVGTFLDGFKVRAEQVPDGTEESISRILSVLDPGDIDDPILDGTRNVALGLANKDKLNYRYLIDSFGGGLTSRSKQPYLNFLAFRGDAFGILNAPSKRDFANSRNPKFTNADGSTINYKFIQTGGDLSLAPPFRYSLGTGRGASYVGYYYPYMTVNDNGKGVEVPPASYVAAAFMRKFVATGAPAIGVGEPIAGVNYGRIFGNNIQVESDVLKPNYELLRNIGINTITNKINFGLIIESNTTAQVRPRGPLSMIHVRETLIEIERELRDMLLRYQWEENTPAVRADIVFQADQILDYYKNQRYIHEYVNIMTGDNNTEDIVEAGMGVLDTFVEPVRRMEVLVNNIRIVARGTINSDSFSPANF